MKVAVTVYVHQIMSAKTKVTNAKTALKQETYNLSDLKHDPHCGFVELGGSVSVSVLTNLNLLNNIVYFTTIALSPP